METVAIVGAGRMGSLIARKISPHYNLILIDSNMRRCGMLAKELGGIATTEYSFISEADFIIIALPASAISPALEKARSFLKSGQILINISTDKETDSLTSIRGLCEPVSAKIIGHALQIDSGELPLVVIDGKDEKIKNKVAEIFGRIGVVTFGPEKLVRQINNIASEEGIRAALNIQKRLKELAIPDEYISFAIRNVACGTMNAFALGDAGPFAQKIINELKKEGGN